MPKFVTTLLAELALGVLDQLLKRKDLQDAVRLKIENRLQQWALEAEQVRSDPGPHAPPLGVRDDRG